MVDAWQSSLCSRTESYFGCAGFEYVPNIYEVPAAAASGSHPDYPFAVGLDWYPIFYTIHSEAEGADQRIRIRSLLLCASSILPSLFWWRNGFCALHIDLRYHGSNLVWD